MKSTIQVLLIEDNLADALLLRESLRDDALADFQVTVAEKLEQGLSELERRKFDVLLLDLGLPDSQGLKTFETAHARFPNIPIIVLSGMSDELIAYQAVQSGAQDYLVKGGLGWNLGPRAIRYAIERHQSQLDMLASELRFSTVFHFSPTPTAITRLSDNQVLEVNEAWSQITGYPYAEVIGRKLDEFNLWERLEDQEQVIAQLRQDGVARDFEFRVRRKSGELADLLFSAELIELAGETCMLSMALDITERKRGEEQVRLQLERMRALSEIDRAIGSSFDMRLSLDILLDQVLSQLEVDAASILLLNASSQNLEYEAGKGFRSLEVRESRMLLGQGFAGRVGLERKLLHVPDLAAFGGQFMRQELIKEEKFVEYFGVPLVAKGLLKGVLEVFHRTPLNPDAEWVNYLETLGGQAAIAIDNAQMFETMQQSNLELVQAYDATIEGWSRAMDLRDKETQGHSQRVTELTVKLAKKMGVNPHDVVQIRRGALLHDIGKLGVPDQILNKPDKLDRIEWAVMRQHPTYAFNMLMSINYLRSALDIPYCHHEKWDGTGYPRGLQGEEIPLAARIFAVVDVWDALCSDRPYREGWPVEKVREHLIEEAGSHFDPQVVQAFLQIIEEE